MIKIGLIGYGKTGRTVAEVLANDPRYELRWIACRESGPNDHMEDRPDIRIIGMAELDISQWFDENPVDAIIDFSQADAVYLYGEEIKARSLMLVTAISAYTDEHLSYLRTLSESARIMSSPNITLGINFLMVAAKFLRKIAPFADVEIVEQHFREKSEVSGTARKIAESLGLGDDRITSLRVGGIVGHHEVIFGFPHQTLRLSHDSIRREAFGTGTVFALQELMQCANGFYTFDDLLMKRLRAELINET